jgi:mycothiol synthase
MNILTPNVAIRHPRKEDAHEITDMLALCDIDDYGVPDITLEDLLHMWSFIHIESDAWVVCAASEKIIGYAFLERRGEDRIDTCVFVHPEHKNQGIGSTLLSVVEERARKLSEQSEKPLQLMNQIPFTNLPAINLVHARGFTFSRLYKRMIIELTEQLEDPNLPPGMAVRSFLPDHDEEALYELYDETFRDAWGYSKTSFSEWIHQQKGERYDPSLWFIVWEAETPVAFLMGKLQDDGMFIDLLGVRRAWRKQGIGHSMLLHMFQTAYLRGQHTVMLNVDSNSLTNAHLLYERAGMRPAFQTAIFRKEIR